MGVDFSTVAWIALPMAVIYQEEGETYLLGK